MKNMPLILGAASLVLAAGFTHAQSTLKPGDPAPALKVGKWVKGGPVEKLEPGQIYVVEFWATWCGPCKVSIPHLTEVASRFKDKVKVIGVSVWERETDDTERLEKIEKFVKSMGEKMEYNVAADVTENFMAKEWMQAAGENGIPSAFIVGKDGRVAWIGHPMDGLDKALEDVLAGTFDVKTYAQKRADRKAADAKLRELSKTISELRRDGKPKEALEAIDKAVAGNPELAQRLAFQRLNLLFEVDEPAAVKEVRKLADGEWKDNARYLSSLASSLSSPSRKSPDYELALSLGQRAVELSKNSDAFILSTLADVYFAKGDAAKAISTQQEAIKVVEKQANAPESQLNYLKSKLERFQKGKEAKAK